MFFKNLIVFRLVEDKITTAAALSEALSKGRFCPPGQTDLKSAGWVAPRPDGDLAYNVGRQILIALRVEEKILPSSVVRKETLIRAKAIEKEMDRKVGRKEMRQLAEAVTQEFLPRAFSNDRHTLVWVDPINRWVVVDGSKSRAEEVIELLAKTLADLPLKAVATAKSPGNAMTQWLAANEAPAAFSIDRDCELKAGTGENATVKYAHHALDGDDVRHHLGTGKTTTRLAMTFDDRISFVLTDAFEIKRVVFLDLVAEQAEQQSQQNEEDIFDSEFAIMTGELARLFPALVEALGGEEEAE